MAEADRHEKLWGEFDIRVPPEVTAIFEAATRSHVGDGRNTPFWTDRWLDGEWIRDRFPRLASRVRKKIWQRRTVEEACRGAWRTDVGPDMAEDELHEFFLLWELTTNVTLTEVPVYQTDWSGAGRGMGYTPPNQPTKLFSVV